MLSSASFNSVSVLPAYPGEGTEKCMILDDGLSDENEYGRADADETVGKRDIDAVTKKWLEM